MLSIERIKVCHISQPLGIDRENPILTWNISGAAKQTAFEVHASGEFGQTYDSGRIRSNAMQYILPIAFQAREHIEVTLTVWNDRECASAKTQLEYGLSQKDWQAKWINPELTVPSEKGQRPAGYLKKKFRYEGGRKARLYATAHGIYNIYLNGTLLREFVMAPGTSEYHERLQYQTYDIAKYLKEGENEIIVSIGNGWWRGTTTYEGIKNGFGNDIAFLCRIEEDNRLICMTDETWLASTNGPIRDSDNMNGEVYDARLEEGIFGNSDSIWHPAEVVDFGYGNLFAENCPPPTEHEVFHPTVFTDGNGDTVLDFGQNLAGYVRFTLDAKEGTKIRLLHGETLDERGCFSQENFQSVNYRCEQTVEYTCKEGLQTYQPTTTFMGFQYVKVEGLEEVDPSCFEAVAVYSDLEQTSRFSCGNAAVNQLYKNAVWSLKGNLLDIPTDCPTREKSGFTGDFQAFIHTFLYMMDGAAMVNKFMENLSAKQFEDGCVKQITGNPGERNVIDGSTGWADAMEVLPLMTDKRYGGVEFGEKYYDNIKRWTDYNLNRAAGYTREDHLDNPYHEYFLDSGYHWGEWLEPGWDFWAYMEDIRKNGDPEVATAYLSYECQVLSKLAEILGKTEESLYYAEAAEKAKQAYRYAYAKNGKIISDRMCRYVRPINLNLLDETEKKAAACRLNQMVIENGYHLNTGFLTTHMLMRTLSDMGYADTAYRLLLQEEAPGWLYSVLQGATSIPENWEGFQKDGTKKDSFNHYSYGAIVGWLMDTAAGIRVENGNITLCPIPCKELGFAEAEYLSPYGKIKSSWSFIGGRIRYSFEVPGNMTASLHLPGGEVQILSAGEYVFERPAK